MHDLGQVIAEVMLHDKGGAALAGLTVDADNGLVLPAHIGRVDGEVGDLPILRCYAPAYTECPFVDGILMGAGEGGEDQLARHKAGAPDTIILVHRSYSWRRAGRWEKSSRGVHPLGVQIQRQGDHVQIAGALPVAEQGGFHPFGSRQQAHFCRGHAVAPVVVGVQADDGAVPGQMAD